MAASKAEGGFVQVADARGKGLFLQKKYDWSEKVGDLRKEERVGDGNGNGRSCFGCGGGALHRCLLFGLLGEEKKIYSPMICSVVCIGIGIGICIGIGIGAALLLR
jgi:hypothetical protein